MIMPLTQCRFLRGGGKKGIAAICLVESPFTTVTPLTVRPSAGNAGGLGCEITAGSLDVSLSSGIASIIRVVC
jgi:hypothetical protein